MYQREVAAIAVTAIIVVIVIVAVLALPDAPQQEPVPEPDSEAPDMEVTGMPEWVSAEGTTLSAVEEVQWRVVDLNHAAYDGQSRYRGYTVTAQSLTLDPGWYEVSVSMEEMEVVVNGEIDREVTWDYDMDGTVYEVSVSIDIPVSDLVSQAREAETINSRSLMFGDLPSLVVADDTISGIAESLSSEFRRIGGDTGDRQAFADFIASFVQVPIRYPSTISGHAGEFDYSLYGKAEYWAMPLQTLYHMVGDCEDTSALLCSLYLAAGYRTAMGGISGHVFAGVSLDGFTEVPDERLIQLDPYRRYNESFQVIDVGGSDVTFYSVETIYEQLPVGYLASGNRWFGMNTPWGMSGFYPVSG